MDIIDRYVYAVTSKLPEKGRGEIEKEIKALIYDMMDKYLHEPNEEKRAIFVIEELGDPEEFANGYREKALYLIGPEYYNTYVLVLKIISFALIISISIGTGIQMFFVNGLSSAEIITSFIGSIFSGVLQGAAWVTLVFVIMERNNVKLKENKWNIKDLPQLPIKESKISKSDSIAEIIFASIFIGMLYFSPQLITLFIEINSDMVTIPVFNMEVVNSLKILVATSLVLVILKGILKLIWGKWTMNRAIILSALEILAAGFSVWFFSNVNIWNEAIISGFEKYVSISFSTIINGLIFIILIAAIIDVLASIYKGYKYGR